MRYYKEIMNIPDEIGDEAKFYFWLNTDFLFGDYAEQKWALYCGLSDGHGGLVEGTDKVILWGRYADLDAWDEENPDAGDLWSEIDQIIQGELGYCPEYSVN